MLPKTRSVLEQGIVDGLHLGVQLYVSVGGRRVAHLAVGERQLGDPMTPDTLLLWLSAGKPITALAIAQLTDAGAVDLDEPVARYVPEFATGGKASITLRHVLTHTGGFSAADALPESLSWAEMIEAICACPAEAGSTPGSVAAYQPQAGWYVLGEIVQRITGRPYPEHVRDAILLPLGMDDTWLGMPLERHADYGNRIGITHSTFPGPAVPHPAWDSPARCAACRPGGNSRGPLSDLGRFYEALLEGGRGIVRESTLHEFTRRHRIGRFDRTFKHTIDMGLGFILNSSVYGPDSVPYGYGRHAGPDTFGHSGAQSSCGFADPASGLVVAWMCNGLPGEVRHHRRQRALHQALYEDLELTP